MHTPHCFGEHEHLYGIHCASRYTGGTGDGGPNGNVAVLMLTAGMLSSVGPSRLHVELADELAKRGVPSFRFDLSGIGESLAVASQGSSLDRASDEVRQAMDLLQQEYGYSRFMLFGLCSGADDAIAAAVKDSRIVAASLMDACGYRTRGHKLALLRRKVLPKVLSLRKWSERIRKRWAANRAVPSTMPQGSDIREFPSREQSEVTLLALIDRGLRLQFIYTGGVMDYYSYKNQFFDMFPRLRRRNEISVRFEPMWDHVAMLREDRRELIRTISTWFALTMEGQRSLDQSDFGF